MNTHVKPIVHIAAHRDADEVRCRAMKEARHRWERGALVNVEVDILKVVKVASLGHVVPEIIRPPHNRYDDGEVAGSFEEQV